jgi:hypothetical protein
MYARKIMYMKKIMYAIRMGDIRRERFQARRDVPSMYMQYTHQRTCREQRSTVLSYAYVTTEFTTAVAAHNHNSHIRVATAFRLL